MLEKILVGREDFHIGCVVLGATCEHGLRNGVKALPPLAAQDRVDLCEAEILEVAKLTVEFYLI